MVRYRKELKRTRIIARVREYQSVKEKRIDLKNNESILLFKDVAYPPYGMDEFLVRVAVNFLAEIVHVNIDDVGESIEGIIPYMVGNHGSGQDLVRIAHEVLQQPVFLGGEIDLLILAPALVSHLIEAQLGKPQSP